MSELKAEMKFEMGQAVYLLGATHNLEETPERYTITGRVVEECHGGVQRMYAILGWSKPVPEIALTAEEPPYEQIRTDRLADRAKLVENDRVAAWNADARIQAAMAENTDKETDDDN